MIRKIVNIDEAKCNGCGLCVDACHEGALQLINNKAKLVSESYCDGLGDCLPECPLGAITIEERETVPYDEEAVKQHLERSGILEQIPSLESGCPGSQARVIEAAALKPNLDMPQETYVSQLKQWPCQIKLVPANAPYLNDADLLIAADCTAYAYAGIHQDFMQDKITLIGCPKLDAVDYSEKLSDILKLHNIKSLTVLKMEVPCCNGLAQAVKKSLMVSGQTIPCNVVTISTNGRIIR
jgi:ferredoxin